MTLKIELYTEENETISVNAPQELLLLLNRFFTPDMYRFVQYNLTQWPQIAIDKKIVALPTVIIVVDDREMRFVGVSSNLEMALHSIQMRIESKKVRRKIKR